MDKQIIVLDESNWPAWEFQTKVTLKARGLFETVTEKSTLLPSDVKDYKLWKEKDEKAQELIVSRINEKVILHLLTCDTSFEMWEKLNLIYVKKSDISTHLTLQKYYSLKYEAPMNIFLSNMEKLIHDLKKQGEDIPEKMIITKVLMCLPEKFKYFISAWESVSPEQRSFKQLSTRLLIEEERNNADEGESTALLTQNYKKTEYPTNKQKCFICGKIGHFKKDCKQRKCNFCGKLGHLFISVS